MEDSNFLKDGRDTWGPSQPKKFLPKKVWPGTEIMKQEMQVLGVCQATSLLIYS
jgi:hypothetical protein